LRYKPVDITLTQRNPVAKLLAELREPLGQRPDQSRQFFTALGVDMFADLVIASLPSSIPRP
jgi:hypothetical protein